MTCEYAGGAAPSLQFPLSKKNTEAETRGIEIKNQRGKKLKVILMFKIIVI